MSVDPWIFTIQIKRVMPSVLQPNQKSTIKSRKSEMILSLISDIQIYANVDDRAAYTKRIYNRRSINMQKRSHANHKLHYDPITFIWKEDRGKLRWDLSLTQFNRVKAKKSRLKLFVFGIMDKKQAQISLNLRKSKANDSDIPTELIKGCHTNEHIFLLGHFYQDLRTPNASDKVLSIQNCSVDLRIVVQSSYFPDRSSSNLTNNKLRQTTNIVSNPDVCTFELQIIEAKSLDQIITKNSATDLTSSFSTRYWLSYSIFEMILQTNTFYDLKSPTFSPVKPKFCLNCNVSVLLAYLRNNPCTVYFCSHKEVHGDARIVFTKYLEETSFVAINQDSHSDTFTQEFWVPFSNDNPKALVKLKISVSSNVDISRLDFRVWKRINLTENVKKYSQVHPATTNEDVISNDGHYSFILHQIWALASFVHEASLESAEDELQICFGHQEEICKIRWLVQSHERVYGEVQGSIFHPSPSDLLESSQVSVNLHRRYYNSKSTGPQLPNLCRATGSATLQCFESVDYSGKKYPSIKVDFADHNGTAGSCIFALKEYQHEDRCLLSSTKCAESNTFADYFHLYHMTICFEKLQLDRKIEKPLSFLLTNPYAETGTVYVQAGSVSEDGLSMVYPSTCTFAIISSKDATINFTEKRISIMLVQDEKVEYNKTDSFGSTSFNLKDASLPNEQASKRDGNTSFKGRRMQLPVFHDSESLGYLRLVVEVQDIGVGRFWGSNLITAAFKNNSQGALIPERCKDEAITGEGSHEMPDGPVKLTPDVGDCKSHERYHIDSTAMYMLSNAEVSRLHILEKEWAKKESERNAMIQMTQKEYVQLVSHLRSSLADLEAKKREFESAQRKFEAERHAQSAELQLSKKGMQIELQNGLKGGKPKVNSRKNQVESLEMQLRTSCDKIKKIEDQFNEFRRTQSGKCVTKLQDEIEELRNIIELQKQEKVTVEERNGDASFKLKTMQEQMERLAKQAKDEKCKAEMSRMDYLERLQCQRMICEEKAALNSQTDELGAIRTQLEYLHQATVKKRLSLSNKYCDEVLPQSCLNDLETTAENMISLKGPNSESRAQNTHKRVRSSRGRKYSDTVRRLRREKSLLLSTGVCDDKSDLVKELDQLLKWKSENHTRNDN